MLHTETDDSPCVLIHDDHDPVRLQYNRFAPEEIDAPQAVLRVAEKREPGGSAPLWMVGSVVACKNSADNVLVDVNPERTRYRMDDALAAKTRIALLEADDGCSKLRRWSFWTSLRFQFLLSEEFSVLSSNQRLVNRRMVDGLMATAILRKRPE